MKNIINYILGLTLIVLISIPNNCFGQNFKRNGDTFINMSTSRTKVEPIKTKFTYTDSDKIDYPIYVSSTGSCFINKISKKTNKEYRKYLGPDISQAICKELNIEYKGKTKIVKNS